MSIRLSWTGGLLRQANVLHPSGQNLVHSRRRDGFGRLIGTALAHPGGEALRRDDLLLGPEGRVTAERRQGVLSGIAAKGYYYDSLARLGRHTFSETGAPDLQDFLDLQTTATADEGAGPAILMEEESASASFSPIDGLLLSEPDEWGRRYNASYNDQVAGAPPASVNNAEIQRDHAHRLSQDQQLRYVYDALDRLVAVHSSEGEELGLAYDALGRRRLERRRTGSSTVDESEEVVLHYLGPNVVEETDLLTGEVVRAITHVPGGIDVPILASRGPTKPDDQPILVLGSNSRGDVVIAADAGSGVVVEEAVFGPWGERTFYSDGERCIEGTESNGTSLPRSNCASQFLAGWGIGGARAHPRTKLVDLRHRVYAPHLRSFLTRDQLGAIDSYGLWNYVTGDPINFRDPWGLSPPSGDSSPGKPPENQPPVDDGPPSDPNRGSGRVDSDPAGEMLMDAAIFGTAGFIAGNAPGAAIGGVGGAVGGQAVRRWPLIKEGAKKLFDRLLGRGKKELTTGPSGPKKPSAWQNIKRWWENKKLDRIANKVYKPGSKKFKNATNKHFVDAAARLSDMPGLSAKQKKEVVERLLDKFGFKAAKAKDTNGSFYMEGINLIGDKPAFIFEIMKETGKIRYSKLVNGKYKTSTLSKSSSAATK